VTLDVLLVEDDDLDREATRRALIASDVDLRVHEATTVREAREALGEANYHCSIVDLFLPDGGGLEILSAAPTMACVVLTGAHDSPARDALTQGAQDYLLKSRLDPYWLGRSVEYAIERKRLQLYRRETEHQDRLASLGQLAATVAHEINNPTAFVLAHLEAVNNSLPDWRSRGWVNDEGSAELVRVLADCSHGLDRVVRIVRQLGGFAGHPEKEEPVITTDMGEVVRWALALTRTQLSHTARVEEDIESCPSFAARPGRLSQVITNLLVNAAQALETTEGERIVRLTVRASSEHIVTTVEDSGPGLSTAASPHAFDPFFTTKGKKEGTGLGLSVAKGIVSEHGGQLVLGKSSLGGLKAMVRLPLQNSLEVTLVSAPPQAAFANTERHLTLVVIDDEPALCRAYQRLLRPHTVHAMEATEAVHWLQDDANAESVDAVICDLMMPDLDGRAVYEAVTKAQVCLAGRFVFSSGGVFQDDLGEFLAALDVPLLIKPAGRDALLEAILQVVPNRT
jgi:two-component system cell cycle sensor histidine kinase/response regulator CckA